MRIHEFELREISATPMPANTGATITEVREATSFKNYPLMDEDTVWDKSKAISQLKEYSKSDDVPTSTYKNGFMWFDSSAPDNFTSYKLPYVYVVDGKLQAVPKALSAIVSVLNGGRGGVDIPDSDKNKIKSNVSRYYKKMNKPDPFC